MALHPTEPFIRYKAYEHGRCREAEQDNEGETLGSGHVIIEVPDDNKADASAEVRCQANVAVRLTLVGIQDEALSVGYQYVYREGNPEDSQLPEDAASPDGFGLSQLLLRHVLDQVL